MSKNKACDGSAVILLVSCLIPTPVCQHIHLELPARLKTKIIEAVEMEICVLIRCHHRLEDLAVCIRGDSETLDAE